MIKIILCVLVGEILLMLFIWMMCQVGCYLLEYCVICVQVGDFLLFCYNFDFVVEVIL